MLHITLFNTFLTRRIQSCTVPKLSSILNISHKFRIVIIPTNTSVIVLLPSNKNILNALPPFLMKHPDGKWSLVIRITKSDNSLELIILHLDECTFTQRKILLTTPPFHVGADIWELDYGSVLMTLSHPTLSSHPATSLWQRWQQHKLSHLH